ncbi:MAG: glycosyltransferase [Cyanobacteria bacterium P01_A01_bin.105]
MKSTMSSPPQLPALRRQLTDLSCSFLVGHFSRLSPWKGQHVLIEALALCPPQIGAMFVGDALFGEEKYVEELKALAKALGVCDRVCFLGFQSQVLPLMRACNLLAHTATAPEPFGRVIVEGMLCGRPVVAAADGGALELIDHGRTGWLTPPGNASSLAEILTMSYHTPALTAIIARQGQLVAQERFNLTEINAQIQHVLLTAATNSPCLASAHLASECVATELSEQG